MPARGAGGGNRASAGGSTNSVADSRGGSRGRGGREEAEAGGWCRFRRGREGDDAATGGRDARGGGAGGHAVVANVGAHDGACDDGGGGGVATLRASTCSVLRERSRRHQGARNLPNILHFFGDGLAHGQGGGSTPGVAHLFWIFKMLVPPGWLPPDNTMAHWWLEILSAKAEVFSEAAIIFCGDMKCEHPGRGVTDGRRGFLAPSCDNEESLAGSSSHGELRLAAVGRRHEVGPPRRHCRCDPLRRWCAGGGAAAWSPPPQRPTT